jgi:large repetitive protein
MAYWTITVLDAGTSYALAQAASLSAPTDPVATANGSGAITITWTLPGTQLTGGQYEVTRTSGPGSPEAVCTVASTVTSCQDTGLVAGTTFGYSIAAILDSWQSSEVTTSGTTLGVATNSLPGADLGTTYSFTPAAIGGSGTYTSWALAGSLPAGLSFTAATGKIHGTPTATGTTSGMVLTVTDSTGATASSGSLSITVSPAPAVNTTTLATATQTEAGYSQTLASSGGTAPITWSISSGALPTGLSLTASTGVISGTVGASAVSKTFTVKATDGAGGSGTASLTITVNKVPTVTTTTLASATQTEAAYSQTLASSGGTAPITWSISSGTLPTGLSLTASTGVISGTVGASATSQTVTVAATDGNAVSGAKSFTITVNVPPTVTTTTLATATQTEAAYSQTLASSGGTAPITWSISSGALPTGLSLTASTGVISGTVGASATSQTFSVAATDANSVASAAQTLTITVNVPPTVTTTSLATATETETGYSQTLTSSGGTGAITWSVSGGALPTNLKLTASTGVISGTVGASATSQTFTVAATDANGASGTESLTITVNVPPTVDTTSLATATQTETGYSQTLSSSGGTGAVTWNVSSGALPTGLSLTASTGVISGTVGTSATSKTFTVKATDANGVTSAGKSLTITVNGQPSVTTTSLPAATQSGSYSHTLASTGGTAPIIWSISGGTLPTGLSLTGSSGVISGTVGASATSQTFTVAATDANGVSGTKSLTITVNVPPTVTTTSLPAATQSGSYSDTLASSGGTTPITWSITGGTLPTGLSLVASTGVISGTVGASATSQTFTVAATDANGVSGTKSLTITVNP